MIQGMAAPESKEIDGATYHVLPLPAFVSMRVAARVAKMAAPGFGDVASLMAASRHVTSALEALASGMLDALDEAVLIYLCEEFAKVTQVEVAGKKLPLLAENANHFDAHFSGRFMAMLKWLIFAAGVTYPFVAAAFTAMEANAAKAKLEAAARSAAASAAVATPDAPAAAPAAG